MSDVVIGFEDYSLNNSGKVVNLLKAEMDKVFDRTRVMSIDIIGTDFNDSNTACKVSIEVHDNKISIINKITNNVIKSESYAGNYWWEDSKVVVDLLNGFIKETLPLFRINSITIYGTDFNDGREYHRIEILVGSNKIEVKKFGGA